MLRISTIAQLADDAGDRLAELAGDEVAGLAS